MHQEILGLRQTPSGLNNPDSHFRIDAHGCGNCAGRPALLLPDVPGERWHACLTEGPTDSATVARLDPATPNAVALLDRLARALLRLPGATPSSSEYWMLHAASAAERSASVGRPVGASIVADGSLIAIGTNELPRTGDLDTWPDTGADVREYTTSRPGELSRREEVVARFISAAALADGPAAVEQALMALEGSELLGVIDVERALHAEVHAIADAARRGVALKSATLFTTDEPCYRCRRLAASVGIESMIYFRERRQVLDPALRVALTPAIAVKQFSGIYWPAVKEARVALAVKP